MSVLDIDRDFNSLSIRDLVAARDLYHLHLMRKQHVVATAVGRYLIRTSEKWPEARGELARHDAAVRRRAVRGVRTLTNSEVRPYSWPCVLVFVDKWVELPNLAPEHMTVQDVVPDALLMPDGTRVPVCVVYAPPEEAPAFAPVSPRFPDAFAGGGYPLIADVQGEQHVASIACLVTDGHDTYALTNRHVAGEAGEPLHTVVGGERFQVGTASEKQIQRLRFEDLYPGLPGKDVYVNVDVGLVRLDDRTRWTAQVYGLGRLGPTADLSVSNLSLRLVDAPVKAFGAASGPLEGRVLALFYRYQSLGGSEYVADLLIGPRSGDQPLRTRPGDSGTLWALADESAEGPMPMAVQWGGHTLLSDGKRQVTPYALATLLSTVCDRLNVTVVRDCNLGLLDYWGAVGHYTIATRAVEGLPDGPLGTLMRANLPRISFAAGEISAKEMKGLSTHDFVPLADVPDMVWKVGPHKRGGMSSPEHANHFADMDRVDSAGKTLLELCREGPANVSPEAWLQYYNDPKVQDESKGLLPFRVWQIYEAMVDAARDGAVDRFVCAAGILSHYVGDACQPLHISYLFNGDPDVQLPGGAGGKLVDRGHGVHAGYEDGMVNRHSADILAGTEGAAEAKRKLPPMVETGQEAAIAAVNLMAYTFGKIKPADLVDAYQSELDKQASNAEASEALWERFGDATIDIIAEGSRYLSMLWQSAWKRGQGNTHVRRKSLVAITESDLAELYQDASFLPSRTLAQIGQELLAPDHAVPATAAR